MFRLYESALFRRPLFVKTATGMLLGLSGDYTAQRLEGLHAVLKRLVQYGRYASPAALADLWWILHRRHDVRRPKRPCLWQLRHVLERGPRTLSLRGVRTIPASVRRRTNAAAEDVRCTTARQPAVVPADILHVDRRRPRPNSGGDAGKGETRVLGDAQGNMARACALRRRQLHPRPRAPPGRQRVVASK